MEREGLLDLVEQHSDVTGPRAWKPARAAYRYATGRAGVRPEQAALAAVHPWDAEGAQRAGLTGTWIDREGRPYPGTMAAPHTSASGVESLADALLRA